VDSYPYELDFLLGEADAAVRACQAKGNVRPLSWIARLMKRIPGFPSSEGTSKKYLVRAAAAREAYRSKQALEEALLALGKAIGRRVEELEAKADSSSSSSNGIPTSPPAPPPSTTSSDFPPPFSPTFTTSIPTTYSTAAPLPPTSPLRHTPGSLNMNPPPTPPLLRTTAPGSASSSSSSSTPSYSFSWGKLSKDALYRVFGAARAYLTSEMGWRGNHVTEFVCKAARWDRRIIKEVTLGGSTGANGVEELLGKFLELKVLPLFPEKIKGSLCSAGPVMTMKNLNAFLAADQRKSASALKAASTGGGGGGTSGVLPSTEPEASAALSAQLPSNPEQQQLQQPLKWDQLHSHFDNVRDEEFQGKLFFSPAGPPWRPKFKS